MKIKFLSIILATLCLIASSCQNDYSKKKNNGLSVVNTAIEKHSYIFTIDSLNDDKGNTLDLKFDNSLAVVTLIFKMDTITLNQDTVASGRKYSNESYVLSQHLGETTLTKNGNILFFKKK